MGQKKYDIFISYRREGGYETAKHLYDLFTRDGYNVSFDIDTLRNGDFDVELLKRVEECTDFILIYSAGAFDRILDPNFDPKKDWLRQELTHALKFDKNIIPIMLEGITEFPDNLPDDVARVAKKNGPKYDKIYFDAFYNKLLNCLETPKPSKLLSRLMAESGHSLATVRILSDLDCKVLCYGEEKGIIKANEYSKMYFPAGDNVLKFVGLECETDCEELIVTLDSENQKFLTVELLKKYNARKKAENDRIEKERKAREKAEREAYLLSLSDDEFEIYKSDGKVGFVLKESREIAIPAKYDHVLTFSNGLARVTLKEISGMIDKAGNEVVPLKYDHIAYFISEDMYRVKKNERYGYIDNKGNIVIPIKYDELGYYSSGLAIAELRERLWEAPLKGYIDNEGKTVIPIKYEELDLFNDSGLARAKLNGKWGYIDKKNKEIIPIKYEELTPFNEYGLACAKVNGKWGCVDANGITKVSFVYDAIENFQDGRIKINIKGKKGYVDIDGVIVISCKYDEITSFDKVGLAKVKSEDKWGCVNLKDENIIPCEYDEIGSFNGGYAKVKKNGKWGYVNTSGEMVIPCEYDEISSYGIYMSAEKNEKWGCIDRENKEIIPFKYEWIRYDNADCVVVKFNGKYGVINMFDIIKIPIKYDFIHYFIDGLAIVAVDGKYGYVDMSGEEIVSIKYDFAFPFKNGVGTVSLGDEIIHIDKQGNKIEK